MAKAKGILTRSIFIYALLVFSLWAFILPKVVLAECSIERPVFTDKFGTLWGTATIGCIGDIQIGDEVRAFVDTVKTRGGCVGSFVVEMKPGLYRITIYKDDSSTAVKDGVVVGDLTEPAEVGV